MFKSPVLPTAALNSPPVAVREAKNLVFSNGYVSPWSNDLANTLTLGAGSLTTTTTSLDEISVPSCKTLTLNVYVPATVVASINWLIVNDEKSDLNWTGVGKAICDPAAELAVPVGAVILMNVELFGPSKLATTWLGWTEVCANKLVGTVKFEPTIPNVSLYAFSPPAANAFK